MNDIELPALAEEIPRHARRDSNYRVPRPVLYRRLPGGDVPCDPEDALFPDCPGRA